MPLDTDPFVIGYAPLPQTTDGEDEEPSLLPDLRWGGVAHKDVLEKMHEYMTACNAHTGALPSDEAQQEEGWVATRPVVLKMSSGRSGKIDLFQSFRSNMTIPVIQSFRSNRNL